MPRDQVRVLLADGGELSEVRNLLAELGIAFAEDEKAADPEGWGRAPLLRISSARRATPPGATGAGASCRTHIVVADTPSRTLLGLLERSACDFVVQAPVHPMALRLLILHALHEGPRRRRHPRVALAAGVRLGAGRSLRRAILAQLSARGCGVVADRPAGVGDELRVLLPRELTGSEALELRGRVVGQREITGEGATQHELALVFAPQGERARRLLQAVMREHAVGAAPLAPDRAELPAPAAAALAPARAPRAGASARAGQPAAAESPGEGAEGAERRRSPRKRYDRSVLACAGGEARPLLGLDLSCGGMRVAPDPDLSLGDELKLALYGLRNAPPALVRAVVLRDDGPRGWVLRFVGLSEESRATLARLVDSLPVHASAQRAGSAAASGAPVVISEILAEE